MALFVFHGRDTYRAHQKLKELKERFDKRFGSSGRMRAWDPSTFSIEEVRDAARARSLFGGPAFLIVKNPFGSDDILQDLSSHLDILAAPSDSLVVLLVQEGEVKTNHPLWAELASRGSVQEFEPLKGTRLLSWIAKECSRYGCTLQKEAADFLARYVSDDTWILAHEIQKISLAVLASSRKEILKNDVAALVRGFSDHNAFVMIEAALAGKKSEAFRLLSLLFLQGEHALRICSAIGYQIRALLMVSSMTDHGILPGSMASIGGIPPFLARKMLGLCRRFSFSQISLLHERVALMDITIKTGREDPESSLFMFLSRL